ncbi:MAG: hypothetical protein ACFB22_09480 [Rhodothalassiaceae bacterium]
MLIKAVLLALVLAVLAWGGLLAYRAGLTRPLTPLTTADCRAVGPVTGPEDFAIDRDWGLIWITDADRAGVVAGGPPNGAIKLLRLESPDAPLDRVDDRDPRRFYPHGLGLWVDPQSGERRLFAVNHGPDYRAHSIEIFRAARNGRLTHLQSIRDPLISHPNDVAPVGPRAFFVSNDLGAPTALLRGLEPYLMAPWGNVVAYDGERASVALSDLRYANGVLADLKSNRLYVAEVLDRSVTAYALGPDLSLTRLWQTGVGMGVDNLTLLPQGDVLAAGHPRPLAFTAHAQDRKRPSPSEVVRISQAGRVTPVHLNRGGLYSGASVAQHARGRLFVGSVYEDHILVCPERAEQQL